LKIKCDNINFEYCQVETGYSVHEIQFDKFTFERRVLLSVDRRTIFADEEVFTYEVT